MSAKELTACTGRNCCYSYVVTALCFALLRSWESIFYLGRRMEVEHGVAKVPCKEQKG